MFEIGVISLDYGRAQAARNTNAGIVSEKRRLDVYYVDILRAQLRCRVHELAPVKGSILGITRDLPRGNPSNIGVIGKVGCLQILGRNQPARVP
jgi:hypothetical protein